MDWYDNYQIGVEHIDRQHRDLVETVDKLQKSLKSDTISSEMGTTIKFIAHYTQHHFSEEEELMEAVNFPDYDKHKIIHQKLLKQVVEILTNLQKGKPISAYELFDFLADWVKKHITEEDQRIAKYVETQKQKEQLEIIYHFEEVKKNTSKKMKKLKELYDKELISETEFSEKKLFIMNDFISLQNIDSRSSLKESFELVEDLRTNELITDDDEKEIKSTTIKNIDLAQILKEFPENSAGLEFLKNLFENGILAQEEYDKNKAVLLKDI